MNKKLLFFCPLLLVLILCLFLFNGLNKDPEKIAEKIQNQSFPEFYQADLFDQNKILSPQLFPKEPFILNIWGSWCGYCQQEHPLLMELSKTVPIVGVDYLDNPQNGIQMLKEKGNPFIFVIDDNQGKLGQKLGVNGAPQTYLIDQYGVIRYHHSGAFDREIWQREIQPQLDALLSK